MGTGFCVGDIVIATDDSYAITSKRNNCISVVTRILDYDMIEILVLHIKEAEFIGERFEVCGYSFSKVENDLFLLD